MTNDTTNILSTIDFPSDLRELSIRELPQVCNELRNRIIDELSSNPGHLGANLGVVELTVALHYVLNTPVDKLVWDVGHQAYGHKILTGRRERFKTNRKFKGLSGFPNPAESEYDAFIAGHSSNSISAALGISIASKVQGKNNLVVAVIGDGAMSGGLAYEGLNNASVYPNDLLIILNDNNMSIDRNVGGMSDYLVKMTTSRHYNNIRWKTYLLLKKIGLINDQRKGRILRFTNSLKALLTNQQNFFEGLNIRYFGPVDGHNVEGLIKVLRDIKDMKGPKILHVCTVKGKGFEPAERDATQWHAPGLFNPVTGKRSAKKEENMPLLFQDVFGHTLVELADKNPKIAGITPAMPTGCSMNIMMEHYPERTFDVGIAEGHAVTFSAGLAKEGLIPFCNIYSSFAQRAYDNIIHDAALQNLPIILCLDRAGLVGEDGPTHHGAFDLAYLRCIPNLIISAPIDEHELRNLMFTAQKLKVGPFVIRYPRGLGYLADWKNEMQELAIGQGECLEEGSELAILSVGPLGKRAQEVVKTLKAESISIALYNMRFVKPLDEKLLHEVGKKFSKVITLENGVVNGGFGSAVLEFFSENNYSPTVKRVGLPDHFVEHGSVPELHLLCGIDKKGIEKTVRELLAM
ncbi:MAG TPA: 1-deoxy-D-xylulose-5-phosphate synthase [Bacteroidales bacterium]|nr:1-deoxy-D-xylulose-5-phosphate synthase [Bacteroidales bacterium]